MNDGIFAVPVEGQDRGFLRQFFSGVIGGEVASLHFDALEQSLFITIQHPGEPGTGPNSANSSFETPTSVWPDGNTPPRPSVVVVTKQIGKGSPVIGSYMNFGPDFVYEVRPPMLLALPAGNSFA